MFAVGFVDGVVVGGCHVWDVTSAAGQQFVDAINANGQIVDANNQTGAGRRSRKMKGRAIFRAWANDGGKTNAAVLKAIENSKIKFYNAMGVK